MAEETPAKAMKRRGILAAAGAAVAGIAAKQASQPVAAGGTQGNPLILGDANTETAVTVISNNGATYGSYYSGDALYALASGGTGVTGKSSGDGVGVNGTVYPDTVNATGVYGSAGTGTGVHGFADTGTGVFAQSSGNSLSKGVYANHTASGYAVYGEATASGGYGVTGVSGNAFGVLGQSGSGTGAQGEITGGAAASTVGVRGINRSSGAGGVGVQGQITGGANTNAVLGDNQSTGANGAGVAGRSLTGYGVVGYTSGGSASMSGISDHVNIPAFAGGNSQPGGLAASFAGLVFVNGSFVVLDPANKHGAIKGSDGKHRLLYATESPEPWLEDFGTGTLAGGKAEIKLEARFADVIHTDDYHVFLAGVDEHNHLIAKGKTGTGFTVEADAALAALKGKKAADLSGTFSWRVVARPRTEAKWERLAEFAVPDVKLPRVEDLPKTPAPPPGKKP